MKSELNQFDREQKTQQILDAWRDIITLQAKFFRFQPHMFQIVGKIWVSSFYMPNSIDFYAYVPNCEQNFDFIKL